MIGTAGDEIHAFAVMNEYTDKLNTIPKVISLNTFNK